MLLMFCFQTTLHFPSLLKYQTYCTAAGSGTLVTWTWQCQVNCWTLIFEVFSNLNDSVTLKWQHRAFTYSELNAWSALLMLNKAIIVGLGKEWERKGYWRQMRKQLLGQRFDCLSPITNISIFTSSSFSGNKKVFYDFARVVWRDMSK